MLPAAALSPSALRFSSCRGAKPSRSLTYSAAPILRLRVCRALVQIAMGQELSMALRRHSTKRPFRREAQCLSAIPNQSCASSSSRKRWRKQAPSPAHKQQIRTLKAARRVLLRKPPAQLLARRCKALTPAVACSLLQVQVARSRFQHCSPCFLSRSCSRRSLPHGSSRMAAARRTKKQISACNFRLRIGRQSPSLAQRSSPTCEIRFQQATRLQIRQLRPQLDRQTNPARPSPRPLPQIHQRQALRALVSTLPTSLRSQHCKPSPPLLLRS